MTNFPISYNFADEETVLVAVHGSVHPFTQFLLIADKIGKFLIFRKLASHIEFVLFLTLHLRVLKLVVAIHFTQTHEIFG